MFVAEMIFIDFIDFLVHQSMKITKKNIHMKESRTIFIHLKRTLALIYCISMVPFERIREAYSFFLNSVFLTTDSNTI